jgi:hypothetical protein
MQHQAQQQTDDKRKDRWAGILTSLSLAGIVILLILVLFNVLKNINALWLWAGFAGIMMALLWGLGLGATGKWYGVIVEKNRNRASLSRLQITLWTILVISSFLTMAIIRIREAPRQPSNAETAACKAEYISVNYGFTIDQLGGPAPENPETTTPANGENSDTLKKALEEAEAECVPQTLKIRFPEELLLVLGISTASFAGSSLIKSNKQNKPSVEVQRIRNAVEKAKQMLEDRAEELEEAKNRKIAAEVVLAEEREKLSGLSELLEDGSPNEKYLEAKEHIHSAEIALKIAEEVVKKLNTKKEEAEKQLADAEEELNLRKDLGLLVVANEPKFTDIFYGDQEGDAQFIDLGKVQMFFITIAILLAYGVAIGAIMKNTDLLTAPLGVDFPEFSSSLTTLLGISHAGYLAVKTPDRPLSAG